MTPNEENLNRLEEFLTATAPQTKEEALDELTAQGVDVAAFKTRVAGVVRKGYQHQVKLAAQAARADASTKTNRRFGDLLGLAYERFFPDLFKGLRGQFFTPPALGALLVSRLGIGKRNGAASWDEGLRPPDLFGFADNLDTRLAAHEVIDLALRRSP